MGKTSKKRARPHPSSLQGIFFGEGKVLSLAYAMWDEAGTPVDNGNIGEPIQVLFGDGQIPRVIEESLIGKERADRVQLHIPHWESHDPARVRVVDRAALRADVRLGMHFADGENVAYVAHLTEDQATLDFNSPLAGKMVRLNLLVVDVRDASPEELERNRVLEEGP